MIFILIEKLGKITKIKVCDRFQPRELYDKNIG